MSLLSLPLELIVEITRFMSIQDILSLSSTCKDYREIILNTRYDKVLRLKSKDLNDINDIHYIKEYISKFEEAGLFADNKSDYFCFKDLQSKLFLSQKFDKAQKELNDSSESGTNVPDCSDLKGKINIKRLEYARALHAEL